MKYGASRTLVSINPGRDVQRVGTANFLGEDVEKIHDPVWAVIGSLGDSQCYLGVTAKVQAVQAALSRRIEADDLRVRLISPAFTLGVSDGQLNGTPQMRFSLIGRELVHDVADVHLAANGVAGLIAVVACDKPPSGRWPPCWRTTRPRSSCRTAPSTRASTPPRVIHRPRVGLPDGGPARRGAHPLRAARLSRSGQLRRHVHLQHHADVHRRFGSRAAAHGVAGIGRSRRLVDFPDQMVDCLLTMTEKGIRPSDIVTPASLRNAVTVAIAMGGSTNVVLHSVEIARAAGIDFWAEAMSQQEFNALARRLPVLVNMRPFGEYSMVDVDAAGGLQVIVKELLDAGFLDGSARTCTGESLADQLARLAPPAPDHEVIYSVEKPFKDTGGLRLLQGTWRPTAGRSSRWPASRAASPTGCSPGGPRLQRRADADRGPRPPPGLVSGQRHGGHPLRRAPGRARHARAARSDFPHHGPVPPAQHHHRLMTDARFSGGSVGLVIGHVAPEAFLGGPIALVEDGDTMVIDVNTDRIDCPQLADPAELERRSAAWQVAVEANGGIHPDVTPVTDRVLSRMRATALPALLGGGMAT